MVLSGSGNKNNYDEEGNQNVSLPVTNDITDPFYFGLAQAGITLMPNIPGKNRIIKQIFVNGDPGAIFIYQGFFTPIFYYTATAETPAIASPIVAVDVPGGVLLSCPSNTYILVVYELIDE